MRRAARHRVWLSATGAAVLAAVVVGAQPAQKSVRAPNVEMRDARGRQVRLSDFTGKIVLVDLWASWCPPCSVSFPLLDTLYREYRSSGVEVIAVNLDRRRKEADTFLRAHPHEMLVLFDPRARVAEAFGAPGVPSAYLIDRQGIIRHAHEGYTTETLSEYRRQIDALLAESAP